jgi:hypothetical protein
LKTNLGVSSNSPVLYFLVKSMLLKLLAEFFRIYWSNFIGVPFFHLLRQIDLTPLEAQKQKKKNEIGLDNLLHIIRSFQLYKYVNSCWKKTKSVFAWNRILHGLC